MIEQISLGDIVFSKSHNLKGKVVKIRHYDKSVLVEVIIDYNRKERTRTTKLYDFALSDVKLFRHEPKKKKETEVVEETEKEVTIPFNEKFKGLPKLELTPEALKNMADTMRMNRLVNAPEINFPPFKGDE